MVRGNPVKYNDPSGHCSVNADGSRDMSGDEQCWVLADIIADASWSVDAEWWTERFDITPEAFLNDWAKKAPFDENWMNTQIRAFHCQNGCPHWLSLPPMIHPIPEGANPDPTIPGTRSVLSGAQAVVDDVEQCSEGMTQCGKALSDLSVALAGTAVTCAGLAASPCTFTTSAGSAAAGAGGTVITTVNYFAEGKGSGWDIVVGVVTTGVGLVNPAVGLVSSSFQRWWDKE